MQDILLEHWLSITSLVVALIGGVPGVLAVFTEWRSRSTLYAYLHHIFPISVSDITGQPMSGLILHLAIGNKGKDPLVPLTFQIECKIHGSWKKFMSSSIPEGFVINGAGWQHKYVNVSENDIQQRRSSITKEAPVYGFLSFVSKDVGFEELTSIFLKMPIKLKCTDLFGREHQFLINSDIGLTSQQRATLPPGRGVIVSSSLK